MIFRRLFLLTAILFSAASVFAAPEAVVVSDPDYFNPFAYNCKFDFRYQEKLTPPQRLILTLTANGIPACEYVGEYHLAPGQTTAALYFFVILNKGKVSLSNYVLPCPQFSSSFNGNWEFALPADFSISKIAVPSQTLSAGAAPVLLAKICNGKLKPEDISPRQSLEKTSSISSCSQPDSFSQPGSNHAPQPEPSVLALSFYLSFKVVSTPLPQPPPPQPTNEERLARLSLDELQKAESDLAASLQQGRCGGGDLTNYLQLLRAEIKKRKSQSGSATQQK